MVPTDETPVENTTPNRVDNIPAADIDLKDVAKQVSDTWLTKPSMTLIWLTQEDFSDIVESYETTLMSRKSTGSTRPIITGKLKNLDFTLDKDVENIKVYLEDKYGKTDAPSYYAAFGIVKEDHVYKLPHDRNERLAALELLVPAITTHGFQTKQFGLTYWTGQKTLYDSLLTQATTIDGTVSSKVGDKNVLKAQIKKALNALIHIIIGNYPDTYKTELRSWGFQKEKY